MSKLFSALIATIIFLQTASAASKNKYKYSTKYIVPHNYGGCFKEAFDLALVALAENTDLNLPTIPSDLSVLSSHNCRQEHNSYDWLELSYPQGDKTCVVLVVMDWINVVRHPDPKIREKRFQIHRDYTERANQQFGKCTENKVESAKIQTDDIDVEINEDISEDDIVKPIKETEQEIKPAGVVEPVEKIEIVAPEVHWGPAKLVLPTHNQVARNAPTDRSELPTQEDDVPAQMHTLLTSQAPSSNWEGGWESCNANEYFLVGTYMKVLSHKIGIIPVDVTTENVAKCLKQIVNGTNYNFILSFNGKTCQVAFHVSLPKPRELTDLYSAPKFANVVECADYFKL